MSTASTDPSRPVVPTEKDEAMSLEDQVAKQIGSGMITRESPGSIAHRIVALCRESIARDIEAQAEPQCVEHGYTVAPACCGCVAAVNRGSERRAIALLARNGAAT